MAEAGAGPEPEALVRLMTWLSPGFPVGAFAFSHGLEAAIADGAVACGADVRDWIAALVDAGSAWNDLVLFAEAFRAHEDPERLGETVALAEALAGTAERRAETLDLGTAFTEAAAPWSPISGPAAYPVAVAILAARSKIPLEPALLAYAHGFAANFVAASTRLVPLGQSETVRILHALEPVLVGAARRAARSDLADLGSAAILSDIAAMRHETLATRLFRS